MPDFRKIFQVKCDTSGVAVSVVLSQYDKLVSYFSETFNDAERKYSTYHKEFYDIIKSNITIL